MLWRLVAVTQGLAMMSGVVDRLFGSDGAVSRTVLVADGDREVRRVIVAALMAAGIASIEADTRQIALQKLWSDRTIDVIIAAVSLPGGSGTRLIDTAQAALGRDFEAIILAPTGLVQDYVTIEPGRVMDIVRSAADSLRHVAARRHRGDPGSAADSAPAPLFECLAVAAEAKDDETGRHNRRIGLYAKVLAQALGWSPERQAAIEIAAKLHDIGKIGIPDDILFKQGVLTAEERLVMQRHTTIGYMILSAARHPLLACAAAIAQHHHERWCGGGYPHGLAGSEIPVEARVTALCDVYDALRSQRPYKSPLPHGKALQIILVGDDRTHTSHFDPQILPVMAAVEPSFERIFETMDGV